MYLASTLAQPQCQEENCLEVQMLQAGLFKLVGNNLSQLVQKPQFLLPLLSERPYSLIPEALGAMHGDLDLSDFCEGSD